MFAHLTSEPDLRASRPRCHWKPPIPTRRIGRSPGVDTEDLSGLVRILSRRFKPQFDLRRERLGPASRVPATRWLMDDGLRTMRSPVTPSRIVTRLSVTLSMVMGRSSNRPVVLLHHDPLPAGSFQHRLFGNDDFRAHGMAGDGQACKHLRFQSPILVRDRWRGF